MGLDARNLSLGFATMHGLNMSAQLHGPARIVKFCL